ncbi:uncharacterized protein [Haliotis asinina]|uniref:uncharacterized protein n=1 Tax=Haliotis asinina TaxID=109174 RepID=UPI00353211D4
MGTKEETRIELEESDHHLVHLDVDVESVTFKTTSPEMLDDRIPDIPSGKSHHLFISHSEEDAEWAENLVNVLEGKHGVKCLWPKRGVPGMIHRGIAESMKVVFLLTPDSIESPWCEQERDWALVLSMEERQNRIIPLLLKPCEIPNIFITFNYIDVPKGEDYVNRTIQALAGKDLSDLQPRVFTFLRTQGCGLSMEFQANKCSTYMCGGPSWAFGDLTESQRLRLSKLGSEFAENVYQEAKDIANRSRGMKFYSLSVCSCHVWSVCLCGVLLTTLMVCIIMIPLLYYTDVSRDALYMLIVIGVALIAIAIALWLFAWKNERALRSAIQDHSIRNVMETKILFSYKNIFQPTIQLMYYDLSPCLKHVTDHVMNQLETETMESLKIQDIAQSFAERRLHAFVVRISDELFNWNRLPESEVHRHATFQNKMCVCELMDNYH